MDHSHSYIDLSSSEEDEDDEEEFSMAESSETDYDDDELHQVRDSQKHLRVGVGVQGVGGHHQVTERASGKLKDDLHNCDHENLAKKLLQREVSNHIFPIPKKLTLQLFCLGSKVYGQLALLPKPETAAIISAQKA